MIALNRMRLIIKISNFQKMLIGCDVSILTTDIFTFKLACLIFVSLKTFTDVYIVFQETINCQQIGKFKKDQEIINKISIVAIQSCFEKDIALNVMFRTKRQLTTVWGKTETTLSVLNLRYTPQTKYEIKNHFYSYVILNTNFLQYTMYVYNFIYKTSNSTQQIIYFLVLL